MSDSFWPQKKKDPKSDINLVNRTDWCLDFGATNLTKKLTHNKFLQTENSQYIPILNSQKILYESKLSNSLIEIRHEKKRKKKR